jgi:hypothetical protein
MPSTSRRCRGARPMRGIVSGSLTCCSMVCCGVASSRRGSSASCGSWSAIGRRWYGNVQTR